MLFLKVKYHIISRVKQIGYSLLYGRHISWGKKTTFRSGFHLMIEKQGYVKIGDHCFFNHDCSINCLEKIEIGAGTICGEGVRIYDHNHRFSNNDEPIRNQGYVTSHIRIGNHCWIGSNVVILRKAEIGDNCVIGAGCVINERIDDNSVVISEGTTIVSRDRRECGEENAEVICNHGNV